MGYEEEARDCKDGDPPIVHWYWGSTGTGKSRAARAEALQADGDVYRAQGPGGKGSRWWWPGYDGHNYVIIDDFRPEWIGLSYMLGLLDRYGFIVECKGGSRQMRAMEFWITCPKPPWECYLDAGEDVEQLERRITDVKEFT